MATLEYTKSRYPYHSSEAIYLLIYNENTQDLYVVLRSDEVYKYSHVDNDAFENFVQAESAGAYYNTIIKRNYGPSDYVGNYDNLSDWRNVKANKATVGTPKGLTYAKDAEVTNNDAEVRVTLGGDDTVASKTGNSTGNQLAFTPYTNGTTSTSTLTTATVRSHEVTFTVTGLDGERTFTTPAMDVSAAVRNLNDFASQLGLTVKVKKVTVYFV